MKRWQGFKHTGISVAPFIHSTNIWMLTMCRAYSKRHRGQWISNFSELQHRLEGLVKHKVLNHSFLIRRSGWALRMCNSNKFAGKAGAVGLGTTLWEPLEWGTARAKSLTSQDAQCRGCLCHTDLRWRFRSSVQVGRGDAQGAQKPLKLLSGPATPRVIHKLWSQMCRAPPLLGAAWKGADGRREPWHITRAWAVWASGAHC